MTPGTQVLLAFGISAAVMGTIAGLACFGAARNKRQRRRSVRDYAQRKGWGYRREDRTLTDAFESPPFGARRRGRAADVVRGTARGREFVLFGYRCINGDSSGNGAKEFVVCAVPISGSLPIVTVSPQTDSTRSRAALGRPSVKVESDRFNGRWSVWSHDIRAAHALLTPKMIERLLVYDVWERTIIFEPGYVIVYELGALDPQFPAVLVDIACDIADLVPGFLAQDYPAS